MKRALRWLRIAVSVLLVLASLGAVFLGIWLILGSDGDGFALLVTGAVGYAIVRSAMERPEDFLI